MGWRGGWRASLGAEGVVGGELRRGRFVGGVWQGEGTGRLLSDGGGAEGVDIGVVG